jgi:hypothetical protein
MGLLTSKVPRALETKTKLLGFELSDLLLIFLYLSVTNLAFGMTRLKAPVVWGGTLALSGMLYFIKRNKPENYLQDLGEFYRKPSIFTAGLSDSEYQPYLLKEMAESLRETKFTKKTS